MSEVWLALLVIVTVLVLVRGLVRTEHVYQYPFLACSIIVLFIFPQLPNIFVDHSVSREALAKALLMTLLCLLCALAGWATMQSPPGILRVRFDERRLEYVAALFALGGAIFYYRLSLISVDVIVGEIASGTTVIYLFFAKMLTFGLVIAVLLYARRPSLAMAAVIGFCLLFYLQRIVVTGKRAEALELILIFLLAAWFQRRRKISRATIVAGALVSLVAMSSITAYRSIVVANSGATLEEVTKIDPLAELSNNEGWEMRNAIAMIDATDRESLFDYGKTHWNFIVWTYVPRQIFGPEIKAAMMLDVPPRPRDVQWKVGTTFTGMTDAFKSFWYLGSVKFFVLVFVLRRFWDSASEGQFLGQFLYILSIVPAMHAFTHTTDWVVPVWIQMLIFLPVALLYAHSPHASAQTRTTRCTHVS